MNEEEFIKTLKQDNESLKGQINFGIVNLQEKIEDFKKYNARGEYETYHMFTIFQMTGYLLEKVSKINHNDSMIDYILENSEE